MTHSDRSPGGGAAAPADAGFAAADLRRALEVMVAFARRDAAALHTVWREATAAAATVDLAAALVAAAFDVAPELADRVPQMQEMAAFYREMEGGAQ